MTLFLARCCGSPGPAPAAGPRPAPAVAREGGPGRAGQAARAAGPFQQREGRSHHLTSGIASDTFQAPFSLTKDSFSGSPSGSVYSTVPLSPDAVTFLIVLPGISLYFSTAWKRFVFRKPAPSSFS